MNDEQKVNEENALRIIEKKKRKDGDSVQKMKIKSMRQK